MCAFKTSKDEYASGIAVDVTRQIIEKDLDKKADAKLVEQSITSVSKHLH